MTSNLGNGEREIILIQAKLEHHHSMRKHLTDLQLFSAHCFHLLSTKLMDIAFAGPGIVAD